MKAILTGHTRGLGAAIAANLLSRNIPVLGLARARNDQLEHGFPDTLKQVTLDLSDTAALAAWLAGDALQNFLAGSKSVLLINNAGMLQPVGPLPVQDVAAIARTVSVNVAAPLMLAAAVSAAGATDKRILHISSGAGRNPMPGWSIYCATKAAVDHHARAAALDQAPALKICSLAPGIIDTDMQAEIRSTPLEKFPQREKFDAFKRNGDLSSAEDCARRLVEYLLGDQFGTLAVADLREVNP
ncbi:SDR family oxidoreductase [Undibacterium sp.]|jgi:benzil reductase ((S)-benzoin forming)|uniref:SDR family oxidoreductase n=1 Tax=Undibacterium sp. TaxID=1914977 RepID=UPI002CE75AEB|nr:SDR family oxidoreductase [Undibacterium sp.]HTD03434.1 SDR family oxidoreductase [Undibacterium sp.]